MDKTGLGDRMKMYEKQETGRRFMPGLPIVARMDGRAFHSFTRGFDKPFDSHLVSTMRNTTKQLVEEFNATIGYTQSDEITLIWKGEVDLEKLPFGGKVFKLISLLASATTLYFDDNFHNKELDFEIGSRRAQFDCRVFQVPSSIEATNVLVWREQDAVRNSVQMLAQSLYSHRELQNKNSSDLQDMCHEKGYNWNDLHPNLKRGSYFQRTKTYTKFTPEELERLPEKHEARRNPNLEIERHVVKELELPILTKLPVSERSKLLW